MPDYQFLIVTWAHAFLTSWMLHDLCRSQHSITWKRYSQMITKLNFYAAMENCSMVQINIAFQDISGALERTPWQVFQSYLKLNCCKKSGVICYWKCILEIWLMSSSELGRILSTFNADKKVIESSITPFIPLCNKAEKPVLKTVSFKTRTSFCVYIAILGPVFAYVWQNKKKRSHTAILLTSYIFPFSRSVRNGIR